MAWNGTTATDLVGDNPGTLEGGVTYVRDRARGGRWAYRFTGVDGQRVNLGNPNPLVGRTEFTCAVWLYFDSANSQSFPKILSQTHAGIFDWSLENASPRINCNVNGVAHNIVTADFKDRWVFAALVYKAGERLDLLIDDDISRLSSGFPTGGLEASANEVWLGGRSTASDRAFYGLMDGLRMFGRALSDAELFELYRRGYQRNIDTGGASLFICPTLDDFGSQTTDTALDLSGKANNMTAASVPYVNNGERGGRRAISIAPGVSVQSQTPSVLQDSPTHSIFFWVKKAAADGSGVVLGLSQAPYAQGGSRLAFDVRDGGTNINWQLSGTLTTVQTLTSAAFSSTDWVHVGYTYDGTTLKGFVSGEMIAETPGSTAKDELAGDVLYIGGNPYNTAQTQAALIDDVRIYPGEAISEAAAVALFRARGYQPTQYTPYESETAAYNFNLENAAPDDAAIVDRISGTAAALTDTTWQTDREQSGRYALRFNGTSSNAVGTIAPFPAGATNFTIAAWVKTDSANATREYIASQTDATGGVVNVGLALQSGRTTLASSGVTRQGTSTSVNDGEWHYIAAAVFPDLTLRFYLDGQPDGVSVWVANAGVAPTQFVLGEQGDGSAWYSGDLDGVRCFSRALLPEEITAGFAQQRYGQPVAYNALFGKGTHNEPQALELSLRGQDNAATTAVVDSSRHARHAAASVNTSTISAAGPGGYLPAALLINGANINHWLGVNDLNGFTYGGRVYLNATTGNYFYAWDVTPGGSDNQNYLTFQSSPQFRIRPSDETSAVIATPGGSTPGAQWIELAGSAGHQGVTGYRATDSTFTAGAKRWLTTNTRGGWIGNDSSNFRVADFSLFSGELLTTELAEWLVSGPEPLCLEFPALTAAPKVGTAAAINTGTWVLDPAFGTGDDLNGSLDFELYWYSATDAEGAGEVLRAITKAPATYTPIAADENRFLRCRVVAYNNGGADVAERYFTAFAQVQAGSGGTDVTVETGSGTAVAQGYAPTVVATVTGSAVVETGSGTAVAIVYAPTVVATANVSVETGSGSAVALGEAPTVVATQTGTVIVTTGTGSALALGEAPTVAVQANQTIETLPGGAVAFVYAPTVVVTAVTPARAHVETLGGGQFSVINLR